MYWRRLRDHDEAIDGYALFAADGRLREIRNGEACGVKRMAQVGARMGVAQRRLEFHAVPGIALDGESDDAAGREHARNRRQDRRKVIEINENIGRQNEVIFLGVGRFVG